ncbi:MAG: CAP domain-containing protein, partial [Caryophanon sp.]|nr:CAP domain-containing protein [Caryophanon sp.]
FLHRAYEMNQLQLDEEIEYLYKAPLFTEQERVLRSYTMSDQVTYHVIAHDDAVANYEVQIVLHNRVIGGYYAVPNTTFLGYDIGKKKQNDVIASSYYTVTPHVDQYNDDEVRAVSYKHISYNENKEVQQALDVTTFANADLVGQLYADLANEFRVKNNMEPLQAHTVLTKAAQLHSIDMAKKNYFSHTALNGLSHRDRIKQADSTLQLRATGENISAGRSTIFEAHMSWINSSGHRNNMLSPSYNKIGFGAGYDANSEYKRYYTTKFANM